MITKNENTMKKELEQTRKDIENPVKTDGTVLEIMAQTAIIGLFIAFITTKENKNEFVKVHSKELLELVLTGMAVLGLSMILLSLFSF